MSFLQCFCHLDWCGGYEWGVAAFTYLYKQLGDASFATTKQLDGYATILLVIITTMVTLNIGNYLVINIVTFVIVEIGVDLRAFSYY